MSQLVSTIEMNPSGIRFVTGYVYQEKVYVLESLIGEPIEVDNNGFMDTKKVEDSIRVLISTTKNTLKTELNNFIVILPPDEFFVKKGSGNTSTISEAIQTNDYENCIRMINKSVKEANYQCIYNDPLLFTCDSSSQTSNFPLGVKSENLFCEVDVHMINKVTFDYYQKILQDLNIKPYLYLVSSFALGKYLCTFHAPKSFFTLYIDKYSSTLGYMEEQRLKVSSIYDASYHQILLEGSAKLGIDISRCDELFLNFGISKDEEYPYKTKEGLTLEQISSTLKDSEHFFELIKKEMDKIDSSRQTNLILLGQAKLINGFEEELISYFNRPGLQFSSKVFGARNDAYLPSLGAIRLTSNTYMNPLKENKISEPKADLSHSGFTRG